MGEVTHGILRETALRLARAYELSTFVETGTLHGTTAAWASENFSRVYTVEVFKDYMKGAKRGACLGLDNIEFYHGESDEVLPDILDKIEVPALFWLDAHWGGDLQYGKPEKECPLLGELKAIKDRGNRRHIIMIDDARLFLFTPPEPLTPEKWPTFGEIVYALSQMKYFPIVIDDVIICLPRETLDE